MSFFRVIIRRGRNCTGKFKIITFEEYIEIALKADRVVGIYPECKNPVFINQHVSDMNKWVDNAPSITDRLYNFSRPHDDVFSLNFILSHLSTICTMAGKVGRWEDRREHLRRDVAEVWVQRQVLVEALEEAASVHPVVCTYSPSENLKVHKLPLNLPY